MDTPAQKVTEESIPYLVNPYRGDHTFGNHVFPSSVKSPRDRE
jgi:hypothetical protein